MAGEPTSRAPTSHKGELLPEAASLPTQLALLELPATRYDGVFA
jgi:hypothetical protein